MKQIFNIFLLSLLIFDLVYNTDTLKNTHLQQFKNQHYKNLKAKSVVIVGAGPTGLYAAIQFYKSGYGVTVVEKRKEYTRNQIVYITSALKHFLESLLGKLPEQLSLEAQDSSEENNYAGRVNLKNLETLLKTQNLKLSKTDRIGLKALFGEEVVNISFPSNTETNYTAILKNNSAASLPFNYLLFAGGSKNPLRDLFLGLPVPQTVPKSYGVAVFSKIGKFENATLQKENFALNMELTTEFMSSLGKRLDIMVGRTRILQHNPNKLSITRRMINSISEQQFLELFVIENSKSIYITSEVPAEIVKLIAEIIVERDTKTDDVLKKYYDNLKKQITRTWFATLARQFIKESVDKSELSQTFKEKAKNLGKIFSEKVSSQSIPVEINLEEKADPQKLNFDVNEVNCSIFELVQQSLRSVVAKYTANGHTAFMLAAGDSAVTPHYFAGLGISSGMNMVDNILENIVKFDRDQLQEEDLVKKINDGAGVVTEQALENGQEFVTPLEDEEKKEDR